MVHEKLSHNLTLNGYQDMAETTAIYPQKVALEYLTLGLTSEVGELTGKVAKWYRKDGAYPHAAVMDELGDVLWFVSELARQHGCTLSDLAQKNLDKLADRKQRGALKGNGDNR